METVAQDRYQQAYQRFELKVFLLRLAVILPLLLLAVWLFSRYRTHRYWFFVYGFGLFALFAFFVELLPYLPNFGGYVRLAVGIALTVFAGLRMIQAFQRYAEKNAPNCSKARASARAMWPMPRPWAPTRRKLARPATINTILPATTPTTACIAACSCSAAATAARAISPFSVLQKCGRPGAKPEPAPMNQSTSESKPERANDEIQ